MSGPLSNTTSDDRLAADDALWRALVDRRKQIKAAGVTFSEHQHHQFRKAHDRGKLVQVLCKAMERYKGSANETNLRAMAQTIEHGLLTWEEILIQPGEPWSPYVTARARLGREGPLRTRRLGST
jgi:hypothetical protein